MKKLTSNIIALFSIVLLAVPALYSCSDDPDESNYYSFTGKMMSDYLKDDADCSMFADIITRAGLMDQLSAYGHYTLFLPNNAAVTKYLSDKSLTFDQLTKEQCDTIARTHLMDELYSTADMNGGTEGKRLPTMNMLSRNVYVNDTIDGNNNATILVNYTSMINYETKNDSVENGIVQKINVMLENNSRSIAYYVSQDPDLKLFAEALNATELNVRLDLLEDDEYREWYEQNHKASPKEDIETGSRSAEACYWPERKQYGFTIFAVPDEVFKQEGITDLKSLYDYACTLYDNDEVFGKDKNADSHSFENIKDPANPLYRFIAYHILDRNVQSYNELTVKQDAGIDTRLVNPTEWYATLLPHSLMKIEKLYTEASLYQDMEAQKKDFYLNRRLDMSLRGAKVTNPSSGNTAANGIYFYVNHPLKFNKETRDLMNTRIRMDFSTIFPEIMNNGMRMNGKDITGNNTGKNYQFPDGYLDGVVYNNSNTRFTYWYPKSGYYSMNGDEMDAQLQFDLTFNIPAVPFESDWQIRLGFAPMSQKQGASRGQVQVYWGELGTTLKAQGIPLNMAEPLNEESVYGSAVWKTYSTQIRNDSIARQTDFKLLKNKGYYRGPFSVFTSSDGTYNGSYTPFTDHASTVRKVLCTVHMEPGKTYCLRIKNVSTSLPQRKEAMLDYMELVPKSVYGITDGANAEDDL